MGRALKFSNNFLGLIAEYIRRHHYRESVQVLCHFMPIRDEEAEEEEDENQTESDSENDEAIDDLPNGQNQGANGVAVNDAARDLRYEIQFQIFGLQHTIEISSFGGIF